MTNAISKHVRTEKKRERDDGVTTLDYEQPFVFDIDPMTGEHYEKPTMVGPLTADEEAEVASSRYKGATRDSFLRIWLYSEPFFNYPAGRYWDGVKTEYGKQPKGIVKHASTYTGTGKDAQ